MQNSFIATRMKKHPIANGEAIYSVVETVVGTYDPETKLFTDENGVVYKHILDNSKASSEKAKKEYYNLADANILKDRYPTCTEMYEVAEMYNDEKCSTIYYTANLDPQKPMIMAIDTDNLKEVFRQQQDPNRRAALPSETEETAELIAAIASGCYSETQLEDIKESALLNIEYLKSIIESCDEHLKKDEESCNYNIREVFQKVKETVVDQDEAAKRLIVEIERNLDQTDGTGILITGNTGTGKTLLVETIAKYIDRPFISIDSSQLSSPGYVGKKIEQYLWDLFVKSGYDLDAAEHAIVYFDEIDKKGSEKKSDVGGQAVLNQLLKFLDGTTYKATDNPQHVTEQNSVDISTDNMLVIAGGAFSEIYEAKAPTPIGFASTAPQAKDPEIKDFIDKAMMPKELMGRLPVIIHLNPLTIDSLKRILTNSDKSALKLQEANFTKKGVELKVTPEYLQRVAEVAHERKIGARGLSKIIKDTTWRPYDIVCYEQDVYDQVILDEQTVSNPEHFQLVKKRTN